MQINKIREFTDCPDGIDKCQIDISLQENIKIGLDNIIVQRDGPEWPRWVNLTRQVIKMRDLNTDYQLVDVRIHPIGLRYHSVECEVQLTLEIKCDS